MVEKEVIRMDKHTDRDVYVAWVLWVIGMSERSIATVLMKRPKQIAGLVNRSPYANRSAMTDGERESELKGLLAIRIGENGKPIDGGLLDRIPLKIIPLRGKQKKGARG